MTNFCFRFSISFHGNVTSCHRKTRQFNRIVIVNEREKEHSEEGEKLQILQHLSNQHVGLMLVGVWLVSLINSVQMESN